MANVRVQRGVAEAVKWAKAADVLGTSRIDRNG
jgi:hypothetical protein